MPPRIVFTAALFGCLVGNWSQANAAELERNNWAVLVETSRYWYNYRHSANVLSVYYTIKRLGIPDSQIILMFAEDMACNPRNSKPGNIFRESRQSQNLYGEDVEVDYRGDEVSVENFLRLLTGRHPPGTPRNKRLLTDSMSNVLVYITGHSGEEFIKFQDWEELTSNDIADGFAQMRAQRRYRKIFWISDTCQAATLQNQFYSPEILAIGSSGKKENSYSHHIDHDLGVAVIDRFTYYALDLFNQLTPAAGRTVTDFQSWFNPRLLNSNPELRSDLFSELPNATKLTEFFASTGRMRFQSDILQLQASPVDPGLGKASGSSPAATCLDPLSSPAATDAAGDLQNGSCRPLWTAAGGATAAGVGATAASEEPSLWTSLSSFAAAVVDAVLVQPRRTVAFSEAAPLPRLTGLPGAGLAAEGQDQTAGRPLAWALGVLGVVGTACASSL